VETKLSSEDRQRILQEIKKKITDAINDTSDLMAKLIEDEVYDAINREDIISKLELSLAGSRIEKNSAPYISAAVLLAFSGMKIDRKKIVALLESIGVKPKGSYLLFMDRLRMKSNVVYAPMLTYLRLLGAEVSTENIAKLAKAVRMDYDKEAIMHAVGIYEGKAGINRKKRKIESAISKIMSSSAMLIGKFELFELDRTIESGVLFDYFTDIDTFISYVAAVGMLDAIGKEVDENGKLDVEAVGRVLDAVGAKRQEKMLEFIKKWVTRLPRHYTYQLYTS
jgi:ribosomal protein L12E/L44/L45/RPP1/RPP2